MGQCQNMKIKVDHMKFTSPFSDFRTLKVGHSSESLPWLSSLTAIGEWRVLRRFNFCPPGSDPDAFGSSPGLLWRTLDTVLFSVVVAGSSSSDSSSRSLCDEFMPPARRKTRKYFCFDFHQSINQSIDRANGRPVDRTINQSIEQWTD